MLLFTGVTGWTGVGVNGAGDLVELGCGFVLGTVTPLSHTSFLPDLTHVKSFPETTDVAPALRQVPPAFMVDAALRVACPRNKTEVTRTRIDNFWRENISER